MPKGKSIYQNEYPYFLVLLREAREAKGMTQADVALAAGISQPYVSQVERGVLRVDTLQLRTWLHACGSNLGRFGRELEKRLDAAGF